MARKEIVSGFHFYTIWENNLALLVIESNGNYRYQNIMKSLHKFVFSLIKILILTALRENFWYN